jgi:hypothetical protein
MTLKRYRAKIKLPIGVQEVEVQADGLWSARQLIESMYGSGSIFIGPWEVLGG